MTQLTCKERVKNEYRNECKNLKTLFAVMDGEATKKQKQEFESYFGYEISHLNEDQQREDATTALCNYGLSIDYVSPNTFKGQRAGYLRWQISWGGPSDEFRFYFVPGENKPYKIEYWFMDWFDGAKVTCTNGEIALRLWHCIVTLS
jgi:hypothetical protein